MLDTVALTGRNLTTNVHMVHSMDRQLVMHVVDAGLQLPRVNRVAQYTLYSTQHR